MFCGDFGIETISTSAVFKKDCLANLSETFGNVSESFGRHSFVYVIPRYVHTIFGCKYRLEFWEALAIVTHRKPG